MKWLFLLCLFVPSQLVDVGTPQEDWEDLYCKSSLVAHEALNQSVEGKRAVLDVIVYRMAKEGTSCRFVALQRKQFSGFTASKIQRKWLTSFYEYANMSEVCKECSHFVREDVQVVWARKMKYRGQWGSHKFYLEK